MRSDRIAEGQVNGATQSRETFGAKGSALAHVDRRSVRSENYKVVRDRIAEKILIPL
jgi:hypothetical protein